MRDITFLAAITIKFVFPITAIKLVLLNEITD